MGTCGAMYFSRFKTASWLSVKSSSHMVYLSGDACSICGHDAHAVKTRKHFVCITARKQLAEAPSEAEGSSSLKTTAYSLYA